MYTSKNIEISIRLIFLLLAIYSPYEIYDELSNLANNEETLWHVSIEIFIVLGSFSGFSYFIYVIYTQRNQQKQLEENLIKVKKDLEGSNIRLQERKQERKKEYQKVIQWQFNEWKLQALLID